MSNALIGYLVGLVLSIITVVGVCFVLFTYDIETEWWACPTAGFVLGFVFTMVGTLIGRKFDEKDAEFDEGSEY